MILMLRAYVAKQNIYAIFIMSVVLPLGRVHKFWWGGGTEKGESYVFFSFF